MDCISYDLILKKTDSKGSLFLGNLATASDSELLKMNNINAILTISNI